MRNSLSPGIRYDMPYMLSTSVYHILSIPYTSDKKKNATSERVNFPVPPLLEISEVRTESTWSTRGGTSVHHWNRPHHWAPVDVWMSKNKLPINMPRHHIIPNFNVPTKKRSWLDHSSNNIKDTRKRHQTMSRLKKLQTPRFRASQPCVKLILSGQSTNILDCLPHKCIQHGWHSDKIDHQNLHFFKIFNSGVKIWLFEKDLAQIDTRSS